MSKVELTPAKLANIKEKAEAAADSPWTVDGLEVVRLRPSDFDDPTDEVYQVASCEWIRNAEHIAAADPATVLSLVARIRQLEEQVAVLSKIERDRWLQTAKMLGIKPEDVGYGN